MAPRDLVFVNAFVARWKRPTSLLSYAFLNAFALNHGHGFGSALLWPSRTLLTANKTAHAFVARWKTATLKYASSASDIPLNDIWTKRLAGMLPSGTVLAQNRGTRRWPRCAFVSRPTLCAFQFALPTAFTLWLPVQLFMLSFLAQCTFPTAFTLWLLA